MKYKKRKTTRKTLAPMSAIAAGFAMAGASANAQTPVFSYQFPASWNGTGTAITDQSSAGNNGVSDGTLSLAAAVPVGAPGGAQSLNTTLGGIITSANLSLANSVIAAAGGFNYNVSFMWNGTDSTSFGHTQKLIDYAGTDSLQLVTTTGSASLQMAFAEGATGTETVVVSTTVLPNIWYNVSLTFDTEGNSVDGNGFLAGEASMVVNGGTAITGAATKGTYGDSLDRPIGVGQLGANFGYLVGFKGDIYNPTVSLIPEPSSLSLGLLGGLSGLGMMWKNRRRKT